jgi:hypothetical protein
VFFCIELGVLRGSWAKIKGKKNGLMAVNVELNDKKSDRYPIVFDFVRNQGTSFFTKDKAK